MSEMMLWARRVPPWSDIPHLILKGFEAHVMLSVLSAVTLFFILGDIPSHGGGEVLSEAAAVDPLLVTVGMILLFAFVEELCFRGVPFAIASATAGVYFWPSVVIVTGGYIMWDAFGLQTALVTFGIGVTVALVRYYRLLAEEIAVVLLVVCTGAWFGYVHGGAVFIFMQGLGGLVYGVLYLKCGGLHGAVAKPLITTSLSHGSFNGFIVLLGSALS